MKKKKKKKSEKKKKKLEKTTRQAPRVPQPSYGPAGGYCSMCLYVVYYIVWVLVQSRPSAIVTEPGLVGFKLGTCVAGVLRHLAAA